MRHHKTDSTAAFLPETFTLISWNVHKEMGKPAFEAALESLLHRCGADLVLLQEAVLDRFTQTSLPGYNYSAAVNLDLRYKQYGVLTAALCPIRDVFSLKTNRREMHFATKKSLLVTTHPFSDGGILTAVNLHAINFVSAAVFVEEIERLIAVLQQREGPMIVSGDFNTWSRKRLDYLERFARAINLFPAVFENGHYIKRRFAKPLDHVYYRGLTLESAEAVDTRNVSDHNPIIATFRR